MTTNVKYTDYSVKYVENSGDIGICGYAKERDCGLDGLHTHLKVGVTCPLTNHFHIGEKNDPFLISGQP
jgi:hypothetical protein